jgi:hypothetical protein
VVPAQSSLFKCQGKEEPTPSSLKKCHRTEVPTQSSLFKCLRKDEPSQLSLFKCQGKEGPTKSIFKERLLLLHFYFSIKKESLAKLSMLTKGLLSKYFRKKFVFAKNVRKRSICLSINVKERFLIIFVSMSRLVQPRINKKRPFCQDINVKERFLIRLCFNVKIRLVQPRINKEGHFVKI